MEEEGHGLRTDMYGRIIEEPEPDSAFWVFVRRVVMSVRFQNYMSLLVFLLLIVTSSGLMLGKCRRCG